MSLKCETQICFHCKNTSTQKKRLAMHETCVHGPKLSCKIRVFKSVRKDKLMKHKERVHENKRFECETCDSGNLYGLNPCSGSWILLVALLERLRLGRLEVQLG